MELAQLLGLINSTAQGSAASAAELSGAFGAQMGAQAEQIAATQRLAESQKVVTERKARGEMEAQQGARTFAREAGTDMASASEIMSVLANTARQTALELDQKQRVVNQVEANSNLGNLGGLFYDIFHGDKHRAELAGAQARFKNATDSIHALNSATQTVAQTQRAIAEVENETTILARLEGIQAEAELNMASIRERQASTNASRISALDQMNRNQLSTYVMGYNLVAQEEQRMWTREQRELDRALRQANKKEEETLLKTANDGLAVLGLAPVGSMQALRLYPNDVREKALQMGSDLAFGRKRFGSSPMDSLATVSSYQSIEVPEVQQPVVNWMNEKANEITPDQLVLNGMAKSTLEARTIIEEARKKPEKWMELGNQYLRIAAAKEAEELKLSDTSGLYSLPPVDVIANKPNLYAGNKFLEEVVQPILVAGGNGQFDPGKFIMAGLGKYSSDEIAEGMAAISSMLYAEGPMLKNLTGAFGLPDLAGYPTTVTVNAGTNKLIGSTGSFGLPGLTSTFSKKFNILDPAEWNSYLSELAARQVSSGVLGAFRDRLVKQNRVYENE